MDNTYVGKRVTIQKISEPEKIYYGRVSLYRDLTNLLVPEEYQEVEYIESVGATQYIDTGIQGTENIGFDIKFNIKDNGCILGAQNTYATRVFRLQSNTAGGYLRIGYNSSDDLKHISANITKNTIQTTSLRNLLYTDPAGEKTQLTGIHTFTTPKNITLFALDAYSAVSTIGNMQLYYCKFYDGDTLIRNFIPCYRKADGEIGLYDRVNGVFYTNDGTGTFAKGNDVIYENKFTAYISCPTLGNNIIITDQNEDDYIIKEVVTDKLPKEYQRVDYIESSGTQYIDTGIKGNQDTGFEIKFICNNGIQPSIGYGCIFGARQSSGTNEYQLTTHKSGSSSFSGQLRLRGSSFNAHLLPKGTLSNASLKNHIYTAPDGNKENISVPDYETPVNIFLFAINNNGSYLQNSTTRLYYCKFYDNDNLILYFIPCYRKSDNEIGLYDTVGKQFYTNQGTGTFEKGLDYPYKVILNKQENWVRGGIRSGTAGAGYRILNTDYGYNTTVTDRLSTIPLNGLSATSSSSDPGNIPPIELSEYSKIIITPEAGYKISGRLYTNTTSSLLSDKVSGATNGWFDSQVEWIPDGTYNYMTVMIAHSDTSQTITIDEYNKATIIVYPK